MKINNKKTTKKFKFELKVLLFSFLFLIISYIVLFNIISNMNNASKPPIILLFFDEYFNSHYVKRNFWPKLLEELSIPIKFLYQFSDKFNELKINIKFKNFSKLVEARNKAIEKGVLVSEDNVSIPIEIKFKNKICHAKMCLKGDLNDHREGTKWSFRIKLKDESILGMRQFSIQHPKTRNYISEWIFHKIMKENGILSLKYGFFNIVLNGKDFGIYAYEESFSKAIIESNKKREGPIIKFNDEFGFRLGINGENSYSGYFSSFIEPFKLKKIKENQILGDQLLISCSLLDDFRNKKKKAREVFDIELLAKFLALTDMLNAEHSALWTNLRFYYNPITSLLEPIGYDANITDEYKNFLFLDFVNNNFNEYILIKTLFDDKIFAKKYVYYLNKFASSSYILKFLSEHKKEINNINNKLKKEFFWYKYNKIQEIFIQKENFIKIKLNQEGVNVK